MPKAAPRTRGFSFVRKAVSGGDLQPRSPPQCFCRHFCSHRRDRHGGPPFGEDRRPRPQERRDPRRRERSGIGRYVLTGITGVYLGGKKDGEEELFGGSAKTSFVLTDRVGKVATAKADAPRVMGLTWE